MPILVPESFCWPARTECCIQLNSGELESNCPINSPPPAPSTPPPSPPPPSPPPSPPPPSPPPLSPNLPPHIELTVEMLSSDLPAWADYTYGSTNSGMYCLLSGSDSTSFTTLIGSGSQTGLFNVVFIRNGVTLEASRPFRMKVNGHGGHHARWETGAAPDSFQVGDILYPAP